MHMVSSMAGKTMHALHASVLAGLWEYAKANDLKPISLNTLGPSLEDVFVRLTEIDAKTNRRNFNE